MPFSFEERNKRMLEHKEQKIKEVHIILIINLFIILSFTNPLWTCIPYLVYLYLYLVFQIFLNGLTYFCFLTT